VQDQFSPHAPIDDNALFGGRKKIVSRVIDTIFQRGRHAIIYGERGVGKTSLANIIKDKIFAKSRLFKVVKRNVTTKHDYRLLWVHAFDDYTLNGGDSNSFFGSDPSPYDVYRAVEGMRPNERPVIIFDEFDRISDPHTYTLMADTIKYLADYAANATVIIVGVADSVNELFGGHPSIQRNVQQIYMPRTSYDELFAILEKRLPALGMEIDDAIANRIIGLSQGLPAYYASAGAAQCTTSY
jgi:Cdc6-like AAA superfamily ATPase